MMFNPRQLFLILIPYSWLILLFLVPFGIVLKISLSDAALSIPPYTPQFDLAAGWAAFWQSLREFDLENFVWLSQDSLYWKAYLSSVWIALVSVVFTLLVGFPIAYGMSRVSP